MNKESRLALGWATSLSHTPRLQLHGFVRVCILSKHSAPPRRFQNGFVIYLAWLPWLRKSVTAVSTSLLPFSVQVQRSLICPSFWWCALRAWKIYIELFFWLLERQERARPSPKELCCFGNIYSWSVMTLSEELINSFVSITIIKPLPGFTCMAVWIGWHLIC